MVKGRIGQNTLSGGKGLYQRHDEGYPQRLLLPYAKELIQSLKRDVDKGQSKDCEGRPRRKPASMLPATRRLDASSQRTCISGTARLNESFDTFGVKKTVTGWRVSSIPLQTWKIRTSSQKITLHSEQDCRSCCNLCVSSTLWYADFYNMSLIRIYCIFFERHFSAMADSMMFPGAGIPRCEESSMAGNLLSIASFTTCLSPREGEWIFGWQWFGLKILLQPLTYLQSPIINEKIIVINSRNNHSQKKKDQTRNSSRYIPGFLKRKYGTRRI